MALTIEGCKENNTPDEGSRAVVEFEGALGDVGKEVGGGGISRRAGGSNREKLGKRAQIEINGDGIEGSWIACDGKREGYVGNLVGERSCRKEGGSDTMKIGMIST